jgi:hypothetical protein
MTPALLAAALRLAETLARENAALAALDFTAATQLLAEKEEAADAFVAAQEADDGMPDPAAREAATRLAALAAENRRLLERALAIQKRVLAVIARAVPKALGPVARYGARGGLAQAAAPPLIVSARV